MKNTTFRFGLGLALFLVSAGGSTALAAPAASVSVNAPQPMAFMPITVSGSGFTPGESVHVMLGLSSANVTADSSGSFGGVLLTIPNVPSGLYIIIGIGQTSGSVAFTYIWVNAPIPAASPSSWYIAPGSQLSFSGSGFAPNETINVTDKSHTKVASFSADNMGSFMGAGSFTVPYLLRNSLATFTVTGATSSASVNFTIGVSDLYPFANPSSWYTLPGSTVSFSGGGFGPGETVNVLLGASTTPVTSFSVNSTGSFTAKGNVVLPFGSVATYHLVGASSTAAVTVPITLAAFYPSLAPSAYYSAPGGTISLDGSGFAPNEDVNLQIAAGSSTVVHTNALGAFSLPGVQLPWTAGATVPITGKGVLSGATGTVSMTLGAYYPSITPNTYYAFPGDTITFKGTGFAGGETVTVSGAGTGTVTAGADGSFSGLTMKLPSGSPAASFIFTGNNSHASVSSVITVGVRYSWLNLSTYWAVGGTPLVVTGGGFGSRESVSLSTGGTQFATGNSDASGNLSIPTAVPFAPPGPVTITALGSASGALGTITLTVAPVYTDLQLGAYAGAPGKAIRFLGHGYLPNEPVVVTTDRTGSTTVASFSANGTGSFDDSSYVIPNSFTEGNLTVTVKGTHSFDQKSIVYYVTGH